MENTLLNLIPAAYLPEVHISQYDIGRTLTFNLKEGASDYNVPTGATVTVKATKPSGFGFAVPCTFSGGVVTLVVTETMTPEHGRFPAELSIVSGNTTIGTSNFIFNIERSPHPEGTIDGDAETILPELTLLVERIEAAASSILDMEVEADTLPAGSQASYSYDEELNKATFGIPQGEPGAGAVGTVANAYDASKTYAVGDYVIHNNDLYRCITAITTVETFTASHWTKIVLADDVTDLKTDLNTKAPLLIYDNVEFTNPVIGDFQNGVINTNATNGICSNDLYIGNGFTAEVATGYKFQTYLFTATGVYTGVKNNYTGVASIPAPASDRAYKFELMKESGSYTSEERANPESTLNRLLKIYYKTYSVVYSNEIEKSLVVPTYWESTLANKEDVIMALQDNGFDAFSFAFISDMHWSNNRKVSPALINELRKTCNIPILVNGGDLTGGNVVEKSVIKSELLEVCETLNKIPMTRLTCIGNHDDNSITALFAKTLNNNEKYNYIERYTEDYIGLIHYDETGTYYYLDDIAHKVRYIVTDCYDLIYQDDGNGGLVYSSMTSGGLGVYRQAQIDWFANEALNVPNNTWSVIVFSHNPANNGVMINDYLMMNVLDAFNKKEAWEGSSLPSVTDPNYICSVSVDYRNKGGDVIGWFCGHTHRDSFVNSAYSYPIIVTTCDTMNSDKTAGTTTEQAFDVVTVNKSTKTINMTRIGYGSDRNITY